MRLGIELGLQVRIVRAAGAGAVRAAGLRHEAVDHAVEHDPVIEAFVHQLLDALDMAGREIGAHRDHHVALGGFQRQLVFIVGHWFSVFLLSRLSKKLTRNVAARDRATHRVR